MSRILILVVLLSFNSAAIDQTLPPGTALPIMVGTRLDAKSTKAGQKISGSLRQEVRLPSGITIKKGSEISGKVVEVSRPGVSGSRMVVAFDQLHADGKVIPLNVSLRALAETQNVFQAGLPEGSASDSESSEEWVTKQVGGEYVFRGRGFVSGEGGKVARWSGTGVWGRLQPGGDCPATDNIDEQSLWIFSTNACGLYGFKDMELSHDGRTDPMGQIVLTSNKDIDIRGGSGWLLLVNGAPAPPSGPSKK